MESAGQRIHPNPGKEVKHTMPKMPPKPIKAKPKSSDSSAKLKAVKPSKKYGK